MRKYFKLLFILVFILGIFTIKDFLTRVKSSQNNPAILNDVKSDTNTVKSAQISFTEVKITAEVADTPDKKALGLSFRKALDENSGMLFVLDSPTIVFFWMKDMLIPLDMIWIMDNKVVDIDKNVPIPKEGTPLTQLPKYSPKEKVNYVLEVNAGFAEKNNIKTGDSVSINF